jgi:hypothetical protein
MARSRTTFSALPPPAGELVTWTPAVARSNPSLVEAVERFEGLDHQAGVDAATFLKKDALRNDPSTRTHLLVHDGRVEGFFALCNAIVRLSSTDAATLEVIERRELPATLLAWVAKRRDTETPGALLVAAAYGVAREAARSIGSVAFVLDSADEKVEHMWLAPPYGFRRSRRHGRLWLPLDVTD